MSSALKESKADSVIHCAGYGLSGTTNLPAYDVITQRVNVVGTEVVMDACADSYDVTNVVFTSTVNVAFSGVNVINGNEDSHLWPENLCDVYSSSKQQAEKIVIRADGRINRSGARIKTCILRLAGVYGPEEMIILGRSLKVIQSGLTKDIFARKKNLKIDFVHVKNVVQAHVKALKALETTDAANGHIFFVTDDNPTDLSFFLDPLHCLVTDGLEKKQPKPKVVIPFWLCYLISRIFCFMSVMIGKSMVLPWWGFTVMETYKIYTDHYFSIAKARKMLGYNPVPCSPEEWEKITNSLRYLRNQDSVGISRVWSTLVKSAGQAVRPIFTYTGLILGTVYFYFVFFGSLLTLGL